VAAARQTLEGLEVTVESDKFEELDGPDARRLAYEARLTVGAGGMAVNRESGPYSVDAGKADPKDGVKPPLSAEEANNPKIKKAYRRDFLLTATI